MLLCADIGNTNITLGFFEGESLLFTARLSTHPHRTADQFAFEIKNVIELEGNDYRAVEDAVICSVVPQVGESVSRAISKLPLAPTLVYTLVTSGAKDSVSQA